jgi:TolB-like protein/DNA-binding winged helix-turn-helix (wHTH) protein
MAEVVQTSRVIRFGNFEVDLQSGELRKAGLKLKLTGQPFQVLAILLEHPGEVVTREELHKRLWPDTFVDIDHNLNTAINKIREALEDSAESPRFVETLPRRGYRFIAPVDVAGEKSAAGQCVSANASYKVESTPRIGKRWHIAAARRWSAKAMRLGLVVFAFVIAVLLAFNVGNVRQRLLRRGNAPRIESLAVLPLANLSGDPQQEYFADGMTEALIAELGQIGSLRVISRTSVMQYKGAKKPLPQIARELNVDAVIEGSVLRVGDRARITAQLIGVGPERHLWARNYERDLRDVLSLQGEIARTIADEVKANVTPNVQARLASARPVNPKAHEAYLRGKFFLNNWTEAGIQKATEYAQQAVQMDPDYAPAYGLLAESYWMSSQNAFGHLPDAEAAGKTKVAAMKAIAIDDMLAEPHVALGEVLNFHEWDWAGSEREFKRAIELNPNSALAHGEYAWCLVDMGRQDESIREAKRAVELDPFSELAILSLATKYYFGRQYDQALQHARKWLEMFPNSLAAYFWLTRILEAKGMYDQELAAWQRKMILGGEKPGDVAALRRAYNVGGIRGAWRWDLERLERLPPEAYAVAIAARYTSIGEKDKALDWLEKGYEEHAPGMAPIKVDPSWDSLRSDPRFQDLLRRMNFPQ